MSDSARGNPYFTEEETIIFEGKENSVLKEQLETARKQGLAWRDDYENARKIIKMYEEHIASLNRAIKVMEKLAEKSYCDC